MASSPLDRWNSPLPFSPLARVLNRVMLLVLFAAACPAPNVQAAPPTAVPPLDVEALAERVERLLSREDPRIPPDDPAALVPQVPSPSDAPQSWKTLHDTIAAMQAYLEVGSFPGTRRGHGGSPVRGHGEGLRFDPTGRLVPAALGPAGGPFRAAALRALARAQDAFRDLVQTDTDLAGAIVHLGSAIDAMERGRRKASSDEARFANETLASLAASAELMGREAIRRARRAGLDSGLLQDAEAELAEGAAAAAAGSFSEAMERFEAVVAAGLVPTFRMDLFEQNIRDALDPQTVGYTYAIALNGQFARFGHGGQARTVANPPILSQSSIKEMNIASTSKTLTAMTVLQLLKERGLFVNASISPWLPASWPQGNGISDLSFRDLMRHYSGIGGNGDDLDYDYDSLRALIQAGVTSADKAVHKYQNANFALFRIIIPYLEFGPELMDALDQLTNLDAATQVLYKDIVRQRVFEKTGFVDGDCAPSDPDQTLLYGFGQGPQQEGTANGDWTEICGGGGWYLSAAEMTAILAFRRFSNQILDPTTRVAMDIGFLGWQGPESYQAGIGDWGLYRHHKGDLPYPKGGPFTRGMGSCWMEFPNGAQVSLLINSIGGSYNQCAVLRDAFDGAWTIGP